MQYKLRPPVTREDLAPLRTGDTVLLSGAVYTARDAAHKRMMELLDTGGSLPFPVEGSAVYYVGPTPERPGQVIGSMVINYGNWVYQAFQEREDGGLKFGAYKYGLENDGLDLLLPEESVYKTPDDIAAAVAEAKEKILSGEIVAPTAVQ